MTISPSLERGTTGGERIRALLRRGIVPALGHDVDCTEDDILSALRDARGILNFYLQRPLELSGLREQKFSMLVVEDWSRVKCPDEIRALVPPLPHFGGGGKLCPDRMLMVPPLPHFFLVEIAYLTTSKLN